MRRTDGQADPTLPAGPWAIWRQALSCLAPAETDPLAAAGEILASRELFEARIYPGTPHLLALRIRWAVRILEGSWEAREARGMEGILPLLLLHGGGLAHGAGFGRLLQRRLLLLVGRARRVLIGSPPGDAALRALAWRELDPGGEAEERALEELQLGVDGRRLAVMARRARRDVRLRCRLLAAAAALSLAPGSGRQSAARTAAALGLAAGGGRVPMPTRLEGLMLILLARVTRPPVVERAAGPAPGRLQGGSLRTTVGDLFPRR